MRKIVNKGHDQFKTSCKNCGCIFTYELIDIGFGVTCPHCGYQCEHKLYNAVMDGKERRREGSET